MSVDWQSLFTSIRVEWRDRGPNTSKKTVNIACPWCGNDPSFHLAVSRDGNFYRCYRDGSHSGSNLQRLLVRLGCVREETTSLLNRYQLGTVLVEQRTPRKAQDLSARWERFRPAWESEGALRYLDKRGFEKQVEVCKRYDLRFAENGTWAKRLLFPITKQNLLVGWVGRAWKSSLMPKYLVEEKTAPEALYFPRQPRETLFVVEGPMDALKIAVASEQSGASAVAVLGKFFDPAKQVCLAQHCAKVRRVFLVLDNDADLASRLPIIRALAALLPKAYIAELRLPLPYKDAAEMPMSHLATFIARGTNGDTNGIPARVARYL